MGQKFWARIIPKQAAFPVVKWFIWNESHTTLNGQSTNRLPFERVGFESGEALLKQTNFFN